MSWVNYCLDFRKEILRRLEEQGESVKQAKALSAWKMEFLIDQINVRRYNTVLEIGTRMGVSALTFAYAIKTLGRQPSVYSIDIKDRGQREFADIFPVISEAVEFSIYEDGDRSRFAAENPVVTVDLLVIDGDHTPAAMRRDHDVFSKLVRPGGMVAMDDVSNAYLYIQPLGMNFYPIECDNFAWQIIGSPDELP